MINDAMSKVSKNELCYEKGYYKAYSKNNMSLSKFETLKMHLITQQKGIL